MSDRLSAFLDGVRELLQHSDTALVGLDDVAECGRALLESPTTETLAAARAELSSAIQILRRRDLPTDQLAALDEEFGISLLAEVTAESRRDEREYSYSLGERILEELRNQPSSPSELAAKLEVEISQISRAARALRDDGRIHVESVSGDGRRRRYEAVPQQSGAGRRWNWKTFVERLPTLRADDVFSDLLPGRVGDDLSNEGMARVCAAFRQDLETGHYAPTPAHEVGIPKSSGGMRPAAALRFTDRLAYAALVERCRPEIEASLAPRSTVLWPRGFKSDMQWINFERFVKESDQSYVLSVDIQSFYNSIRHDILADTLSRAGCDQVVVSALQEWLGKIADDRRQGLPQGLAASDPLATAILAPLDRELAAAGVCFRRHGDDIRILGSLTRVKDAAELIRRGLTKLELPINSDKTRILQLDTYTRHRTKIRTALRKHLEAKDLAEHSSTIFKLLDVLGANEELLWSWYHETLSVANVLSSLRPSLEPADTPALMAVLRHVAKTEKAAAQRAAHRRGQPEAFLMKTWISLLAAEGDAETADELQESIVALPEYADVLSNYVKATAPVDPHAIAGLLQRIEDTGITYDAQWLHLYEALGDAGETGEFDELAQTHLESSRYDWIRRVRAARFMASRDKLDAEYLHSVSEQVHPALCDDVLDIASRTEPQLYKKLSREEGATARALVAAAA